MFVSAKGKQKKNRSDGYSVRNRVLIISHITFQDCLVLFFLTTFLEIAVCDMCWLART